MARSEEYSPRRVAIVPAAAPQRPDTLHVIERPSPPAALLEILGGGAPDDANPLAGPGSGEGVPEDARPSGRLAFGGGAVRCRNGARLGGFLTWVSKQIGSSSLAEVGGDLAHGERSRRFRD
ncbi:MAG: hypothetical protein U0792_04575 [Gemmataceae bacterium]